MNYSLMPSDHVNTSTTPTAELEVDHGVLVLFTVIMSLLTVAMTFANIFVIVALVAVRPLRSASDQLTINMCVSGTVLGVVVLTYGTMTTYLRVPVWGEPVCKAMAFIKMITMFSINLTLMAIGVDRFMKVKYTALHRVRFKKPWMIILVIWLLSAVAAFPPLVGWGWYRWIYLKPICTNDWIASVSYTLFLVIGFVSIPLCVAIYCYGSIVRIVVQSRRRLDVHKQNQDAKEIPNTSGESVDMKSQQARLEPNMRWASPTDKAANSLAPPVSALGTQPSHNSRGRVGPKEHTGNPNETPRTDTKPVKKLNRADIAVIRTMILVVSTYVIFWYPYIICMLIKIVTKERMSFIVETVTIELALLGMALNPIIYVVSNRGFRRDLKSSFKNAFEGNS